MAKSTLADIIDAIRVVGKLDAKGRLHVYRYLMSEQQNAAPVKDRKKKATQEEGVKT